jgi:hypothetical protein
MAAHKRTKSRSRLIRFPEVEGKIVQRVEIDPNAEVISIMFQDRTVLSFDLEPDLAVFPELSDFKTGNWRGIRRWPQIQRGTSIVKWP